MVCQHHLGLRKSDDQLIKIYVQRAVCGTFLRIIYDRQWTMEGYGTESMFDRGQDNLEA